MKLTPKEKAIELFKKYYCMSNNSKSRIKVIEFETAKQCALIAVDEIQKSMEQEMPHPAFQQYWQEVKEQILNQNK